MLIRKTSRKVLSMVLTAALVFGILPMWALNASAAEPPAGSPVSIGDTPVSALSSLGFSTATSSFEDKLRPGADSPYGNYDDGATTLLAFNELLVTVPQEIEGSGKTEIKNKLFDLDTYEGAANGLEFTGAGELLLNAQRNDAESLDQSVAIAGNTSFHYQQKVAFDPYGSGRKNMVATVSSWPVRMNGQDYTSFGLHTTEDNARHYAGTETAGLGFTNFTVDAPQSDAYLSIAAGDYNGDGRDEIAVYTFPGDQPEIHIYKYSRHVWTVEKKYFLSELGFTGSGDSLHPFDPYTGSDRFKNKKFIPGVDLSTVRQPNDRVDDLVIVANPPRYSNLADTDEGLVPSDACSRIVFWADPLLDSSVKTVEMLRFAWSSIYGIPRTDVETMMFCGAGAADIDNDGYKEVVVGGHRLDWENYKMSDESDAWKLSESWYDVTAFSYNAAQKTYSISVVPQWFSTNHEDYNGNINMDEDFGQDYNAMDIMRAPLEVLGFSEQGAGFADSVFINGFVVRLGDSQVPTKTPQDSLLKKGNAISRLNGLYLYVSYAVPINRMIIPTPLFTLDEALEAQDRWIGEAVAGNFNNNTLGQQQVIFTYGCMESDNTWEYSYTVAGLAQKEPGNVSPYTQGNYWENRAQDTHVFLGNIMHNQKLTSDNIPFSICAVDTGDDSTVIRARNDNKEFYFSTPNVITVLQSAPYFSELGAVDPFYVASGSTSFTQSSGSSSSETKGFEVTSSLMFGFEVDITAIVKIGSVSVEATLSSSIGKEYENSASVSRSVTFRGVSGADSVALVMTPYIRYHYEVWDTDRNDWYDMDIDIPQPPRVTQITVGQYDRVASEMGWTCLGDQLGSTPGDPYSYRSSPDALSNWSGAVTGGGLPSDGGFMNVGSGLAGTTITQSLEAEKSNSQTLSWSTGASVETKITIFAASAGVSVGGSYTGGSTTARFSGQSYEGSVAVLPEGVGANYDFQWAFGTWQIELGTPALPRPCLVLGYLVRGVRSLPKAPQDLHIKNAAATSLTLAWSQPGRTAPDKYRVFRVQGSGYYLLAEVGGTVTAYTDTHCLPDTEYTYAVQSASMLNNVPVAGYYSDPVTGRTNPTGNVPVITKGPADAFVMQNTPASFSVTVTPAAGGAPVNYQWQEYTGSGWSDIQSGSSSQPTLSLPSVSFEDDGAQFRCIVTQLVGTGFFAVHSSIASLHVGTGAMLDVGAISAQAYTGSPVEPPVTVTSGGSAIGPDNYTVFYSDNINVGLARVGVVGKGVYTGRVGFRSFLIVPASGGLTVDAIPEQTYTGSPVTPSVTVRDGSKELVLGRDYTVSYTNNIAAGSDTAAAVVTGAGNYAGRTGSRAFTIAPRSVFFNTGIITAQIYTGSPITPAVAVSVGSKQLVQNTDYVLLYANNTAVGTALVNVIGIGNYTGTSTTWFAIKPMPLPVSLAASPSGTAYVGQSVTLTATVTGLTSRPSGTVLFKDGASILARDVILSGSGSTYAAELPLSGGLPLGSHTLTAEYVPASFDNYTVGAIGQISAYSVVKQNQTGFAFNPASVTKTYGDATFTVAPTSGQGTGAVSYAVTSGDAVSVNASTGAVTILKAGSATITATRAADGNYNAATATISITVNKADQTGFAFNPNSVTKTYGDAAFTVAPTGGQGTGAVSYAVTIGDGVSVNASTGAVTILKAGSATITATRAADGNYNAATATISITVNKADQTGFAFNPNSVTKTYGDATFTVAPTGGQGTGAVSYAVTSGSDIVSVNAATGAVTILKAGSATITATRAADSNYNAATATVTITVNKADQTGFAFNPNSVTKTYGDATFTVAPTGGQGTGAVSYAVTSGSDIVSVNAATGAVTILKAGSATITAIRAADSNYNAAITTITINASKTNQAGFAFNPASVTKTYGDAPFTVTASGGQSTGAVSYAVTSGSDIVSVNAATGAVTILKAGSATITATRAADSNYNAATATIAITVNKADQSGVIVRQAGVETPTVRLLSLLKSEANETLDVDKTFGDPDFMLEVTGGQSTGDVRFTIINGNDNIVVDTDGKVHILHAGTAVVDVTKAGDDNYNDYTVRVTITISKADQTGFVSDPASVTKTYGDAPFTVTATGGQSTGAVSYVVTGGSDVVSVNASTGEVTILKAGNATITATRAADGNYNAVTATVTITVAKGIPVVTVNPTTSAVPIGSPLSSSTFSGGSVSVPGSWSWSTPNAVLNAAGLYEAVFTPTDTANYIPVTVTLSVGVSENLKETENIPGNPDTSDSSAPVSAALVLGLLSLGLLLLMMRRRRKKNDI